MSPRPAIFVSAVSRELGSARQLVANTLTFLGYEPQWQDIFGTEDGDLRAILRRRIDACKGVVQLVGECYGAEPPTLDEQFGRVSYTQYEALYAVAKGKKVWYLFLNESFPTDGHEVEDDEKRKLQSDYRAKLQADSHLYHPLGNKEGLEASILKLRDDLTRLRRGVKRWAAVVVLLLVSILGLSLWLLESQQHSSEQQLQTNQQLQALQQKFDILQQGVNAFAEVQNKVRQAQPGQKPDELEQRTYEELSKELGIGVATLKEQLPRFAQELKKAPNASTYERANAAYVGQDYNEAERLALAAAEEAQRADPPKQAEAIKAFELAAWSAEKRIEYADALKQLHDAEALTSRTRDALEWARVQFAIAWVFYDQARYRDAEAILREVLKEREQALGPENPDTILTRHRLAIALDLEGKNAEAEMEYRAVLMLEEKVLGAEDPNTLKTRNNLAGVLIQQGKYVDAEAALRALISLREKLLGPEHPDTLGVRGNLAIALFHQGRYAEAEAESRAVTKLEEKVLGAEHPSILAVRHTLGAVLNSEGKYAEAETEDRAVIALEEKVLGPEHHLTLQTRVDLAEVLANEGKYLEAETEDRGVAKIAERVLGPDHPHTLLTRSNLAKVLAKQGRYAEAEAEDRAVLELQQKVLGTESPDSLSTCFDLAVCLRSAGKVKEASVLAERAAEGARKVLGPDHPDTKKYEQFATRIADSQ